jgi:transcriptional regulator with XRE-family HTH domain
MSGPTNTQRLRELMTEHSLSPEAVAKLLGRSAQTVREWRCANANNISDNNLELLEFKLKCGRGQK